MWRAMESINEKVSGFYHLSADYDVKIGEESTASNKVDVMTSKQFNRLAVINIVLVVYTFLHVIFLFSTCNSIWFVPRPAENVHGEEIDIGMCKPPKMYVMSLLVVDTIGRFTLIFACVAFTIRIIRTQVRKTREQVWMAVMIIMTAISYNPSWSVVQMIEEIIIHSGNVPTQWLKEDKVLLGYLIVMRGISLIVSSVGQLFYVWACSHTFGILDDNDRPSNLRFYGPKILILVIYNLYRSILALFRIGISKLPFSTLFALLADFKTLKVWDTKVFLLVAGLGLIELIIVIAIIRRMYITAKVLRKAQYVKHRGKQIGFRYFVMSNIIAYGLFLLADTAILTLLPRGFELSNVYTDMPPLNHFKHYLFNLYFGPVPRLLNYSTTIMAAYVNLPADSAGFMGWFKGSDQTEEEKKAPITLKVRSKKSDFNHMSSCIVFDLLVELFNLSDVAYLRKASGMRPREIAHEYTNAKGYSLELEILNEANETYAVVFTTEEQILVTFKGTTSIENMKTDLKVKMVKISNVLPTKEESKHKILSSLDWKNAKIHKGFSIAYSSVSKELIEKIETLFAKKERPVYFTGHSLGGSLATIASLDVSLSLNINNVCIITFGSPRCGNIFWSRACDQVVGAHWRVAIRSDIVTTLPRAGYTHTGKRVALTTSGEMFLDPNAIETVLWSSTGVNVSDHAKTAYKKALNLFAEKYLHSYKPEFAMKEVEIPQRRLTRTLKAISHRPKAGK